MNEFHLEDEERIIRVDVASGWMIDKLTFYTNKVRACVRCVYTCEHAVWVVVVCVCVCVCVCVPSVG